MFVWLLVFGLGCGEDSPSVKPQSSPVARTSGGGGTVRMNVGPNGPSPVPMDALVKRFASVTAATLNTRREVTTALNVVPGPCGVCDGSSLAQCAVDHATDCAVADTLARRAVILADGGMGADRLKVAINYPDQWFSGMGAGVPVHVHLYTNPDGPFGSQTVGIRDELVQRFGDKIRWTIHAATDPAPDPRLGIRSTPTWFVNGHRFRGLQSARSLGRFVGFELIAETNE